MFVRFVCQISVEGMTERIGFFSAAYELREHESLDQYSFERLEHSLHWFRKNLKIPTRFNKSKSKGAFRRETRGLSWFKPEAIDVLTKAYELISLLEEHGYTIDTIRTDRIGYVVYEDEYQIVAEPFSDTPK